LLPMCGVCILLIGRFVVDALEPPFMDCCCPGGHIATSLGTAGVGVDSALLLPFCKGAGFVVGVVVEEIE
jgi:hypothetical protein